MFYNREYSLQSSFNGIFLMFYKHHYQQIIENVLLSISTANVNEP